ncbi:hypothetical protein [Pseudocolwellia sp. HL-MZ7]|uniref:hypothetical protein n=1 Tax=Pseudocolwellia sp. HL-MZ7 TaxID=3400627 RepID=UPI003CE927B8
MTNKKNKTPIVLDLNKVDFERNITGGDIWQQDAVYEFNKRLEKTALQAKNQPENDHCQSPTIIHDAIFIGGSRGTGKTVFLQNIEGFWGNYKKDKSNAPKLHFCDSIDPTLLVDHDNFANVVIAHLYNEVEAKLDSKSCESSNQDSFYNALRVVSKSLGKQEHLDNGLSGLDRIIQYRSGIQLVKHFDNYINECVNVLKVDAIVLPIDDIDMALERSYEVLDVVRRLLGCPKVIPVITGDLELYEPIITDRFEHGDNNKRHEIIGNEQAKRLTQEYLKKVLPHHNRISLQPIEKLLTTMRIIDFCKTKEESLLYPSYVKKLTKCFFGPLNGEEKSCDWPKPESAREVTQLIRDLSPKELETENRAELWQRYKVWACLKQDSVAYSNAVTAQEIEDLCDEKNNDYVTLNRLHAFNPLLQMEDLTPKWRGKRFFEEQVAKNLNTDNSLATNMYQYFKQYEGKTIYKSMPVIEHFYGKFKLSEKILIDEEVIDIKDIEDGIEIIKRNDKRMLLDIFTFNNYYTLDLKSHRQIFFSRAYELLAVSLLNFDFNGGTNKENSVLKWTKLLEDLFGRAPFYTVPALFPTKAFNINTSNDENEGNNENSIKNVSRMTINELAQDIAIWERDNIDNLKHYKNDSLMPILFSVFNKVFTQLRLLKDTIQKSSNYTDETLADLALRFKYISINAFATFMKPAPVVLQNVAFTPNVDLIRDFKSYRSVSPPLRDNVGYFFNFSEAETKEPFSKIKNNLEEEWHPKALLLQTISKHPIFELLDKPEMSSDVFPLFKKRNNTAKDSELAKISIPDLNIEALTQAELSSLKEKLKNRKLNEKDHILIFGVTKGDIASWSDEHKQKNKELVVNRAKLICDLLNISFSNRLAQVKFYTDNLKGL